MIKEIEVWADSFHEGVWACDNLISYFKEKKYNYSLTYEGGFIPVYNINFEEKILRLKVYGSYKSWDDVPDKILDLLNWGKPDLIAYDPVADV